MYDVTIPDELLTETRRENPYIQLLHLPDDRNRRAAQSDVPIPRACVYELAEDPDREPGKGVERSRKP